MGNPAPLSVRQAVRERRRCVTAHWLNTVLKKKKMVPPHRALHFPVAFPPGGKPCSQHVRRRLPAAGSPPPRPPRPVTSAVLGQVFLGMTGVCPVPKEG